MPQVSGTGIVLVQDTWGQQYKIPGGKSTRYLGSTVQDTCGQQYLGSTVQGTWGQEYKIPGGKSTIHLTATLQDTWKKHYKIQKYNIPEENIRIHHQTTIKYILGNKKRYLGGDSKIYLVTRYLGTTVQCTWER